MFTKLAELHHWQIDLIATGILLEGAILAVVPEEVVMLAMGYLWSQGKVGFLEALLSIQLGLLPANLVIVTLGHFLGTRIFNYAPFRWFLSREAVDRAIVYVHKFGSPIVFFTRFTPTIRAPVYIAMGLSRRGIGRFFRIDALASFIHIPLLLLLGRVIGKNAEVLADVFKRIGLGVFLGLIGVGVFLYLSRRIQISREVSPRGQE